MKSVITQKVQSVPSPPAHGATLDRQVTIARPDVKEGLTQQLSLDSKHFAAPAENSPQSASKLAAGIAISVGTCGLMLSPLSGSAVANGGFSGGKVLQITSSVSKEDVYMQQLRQEASSLRTQSQGTDEVFDNSATKLVAQRVRPNSFIRSVPSGAYAAPIGYAAPLKSYAPPLKSEGYIRPMTAPSAVAIPVPAPRGFQLPTAVQQPAQIQRFATNTYNSTIQTTNQNTPPVGKIWPTRGSFTSGFGRRWGRMHKGIDIAAAVGTPVVAAADGVVVVSGWDRGGYGKRVDIQHPDGTRTLYGHNSRLLVAVGQQVKQGQQISAMGNTGRSTGPHLHFEFHMPGGSAVNPIAYLPAGSRS